MLADRRDLTGEVSKALARRSFAPVHDRGRVLTDVAVMLADGGEAIADIDVLRHQAGVFGEVASPPTVWRGLDELTSAALKRIGTARARVGGMCGLSFPTVCRRRRPWAPIWVLMWWCSMWTPPSRSRTARRIRPRPRSRKPSQLFFQQTGRVDTGSDGHRRVLLRVGVRDHSKDHAVTVIVSTATHSPRAVYHSAGRLCEVRVYSGP
jgi:hypothetical protein